MCLDPSSCANRSRLCKCNGLLSRTPKLTSSTDTTMFSMFKTNATPALVVYLPPMTYASGSTVDGEVEVDFRKLQEDNIEEIHVRLRGTART